MKNAPMWKRIIAFIIDFVLCFWVFGYLVGWMTGNLTPGGFKLEGGSALLFFALIIAYFVVMNKFFGGTLAKKLLGIAKKK